ncbi:MAG: type IV secretion system protein [Steroidobacteraceae bacterium]
MLRKFTVAIPVVLILAFGDVRPASAQWAVIDVGAIAQLVQQYMTLQEQLTTMNAHLDQARLEYAAMTGGRGMEQLLAGTVRNYLPADLNALTGALAGAGAAYGAFSSSAHAFLDANVVLTPEQLASFSPEDRAHLEATRESTAILEALTKEALTNSSGRFDSLQQLITAIPRATDQKAIMDLQARIQAEQGMLSNESNKLQVLFQAMNAKDQADRLRRREQAIADVGSRREMEPLQFPAITAMP